jgi:predicted RNA binding protein YcfA (HicA-like mRNA interferase family)
MPKQKIFTGDQVIEILNQFGFVPVTQRGSHAKLRRVLRNGGKQTLTIPRHGELDPGTQKAIFRQALRYIREEDLRPYFYTE